MLTVCLGQHPGLAATISVQLEGASGAEAPHWAGLPLAALALWRHLVAAAVTPNEESLTGLP